jgi:NAD(P)-dependent dehydrogenase (short-subunit alcohol dehydrogenase family)
MLLKGKTAIIYGGAGAIGSAVARRFAQEGAAVHLAGRTLESLEKVAGEIRGDGGVAETARVDALDERSVDEFADAVAAKAGRIDVSFNLISVGDVQGTPLVEMSLADYEQPIRNAVRSTFLTARASARHMIKQRSGVILIFGGDGGRDAIRDYNIGGFQVALNAVEALRRQLAAELGRYGIRAVTLHTGGIPETIPADFAEREKITDMLLAPTMLKRTATLEDVGNVAVFAASDLAASMTGTALNITCGSVAD